MSSRVVVSCDECERIKGETNHWFVISKNPQRFQIAPFADDYPSSDWYQLCGQNCVLKMLQKWLDGKSKIAAPPENNDDPFELNKKAWDRMGVSGSGL